jgi:hypothetical protein
MRITSKPPLRAASSGLAPIADQGDAVTALLENAADQLAETDPHRRPNAQPGCSPDVGCLDCRLVTSFTHDSAHFGCLTGDVGANPGRVLDVDASGGVFEEHEVQLQIVIADAPAKVYRGTEIRVGQLPDPADGGDNAMRPVSAAASGQESRERGGEQPSQWART